MIGVLPKILLSNMDKWKYENDQMVAVGTVTSDIQQAIDEQNKRESVNEPFAKSGSETVAKTFSELLNTTK